MLNTIDSGAPTSSVTSAVAAMTGEITVSWSGTDDANGSGVKDYSVYVSDNGGAFTEWLTNTTDTSATYSGKYGHTYGFYSRARDNVGNAEDMRSAADATLSVGARPTGWSGVAMVSVPIVPDNTDPKPNVGFDGTGWFAYDAATGQYAGYQDRRSWFEPAASTPGRGFWAYFPAGGSSLIPRGTVPPQNQPWTVHLLPGWNLVGNPFLKPVTWSLTAISVQEAGQPAKALKDAKGRGVRLRLGLGQLDGQLLPGLRPIRRAVGEGDPRPVARLLDQGEEGV